MIKNILIFIPTTLSTKKSGFIQGFHKDYSTSEAYYITNSKVLTRCKNHIGYAGKYLSPEFFARKTIFVERGTQNIKINHGADEDFHITKIFYDYDAFQNSNVVYDSEQNYGVHIKALTQKLCLSSSTDGTNGNKTVLFYWLILLLDLMIKIYSKLKPAIKNSLTLAHLESSTRTLKWFLNASKQGRKCSPKIGNLVVSKLINLILGIGFIYACLKYESIIVSHSDYLSQNFVTHLRKLLIYLMGSPIGLKLNYAFNHSLGKFFFYHINLWRVFLQAMQPILVVNFRLLLMPALFGASYQIAILCDLISLATFHVYCIYVYAARLFSLQLKGLTSLWRLFIGRKSNPLRNRIDSCGYSSNQLFIGTLGFTILLFLLPTTTMYYTVFASFRLATLVSYTFFNKIKDLTSSIPLYIVILWTLRSPSIAAMSVTDSSWMPNYLETEKECSDPSIFEAKGPPSAVITKQVEIADPEKKLEESSVSEVMDCLDQDIFEIPLDDEVGISIEVEVENEGNQLEESSIKEWRDDLDNLETLSDNELLSLAEICEKNLSLPKDVIYSVSAAGPSTIKTPTNPYEIVRIESEEVNLIHPIHKDISTNDNEDLPLNKGIDNNSQINVPINNKEAENLEDSIAAVAPNRPTKQKRENVKKRLCKPETWKINQRQKMYQSGKEYISVRGKTVLAKKVVNKKDCLGACKFSCGKKIGETERKSIFDFYYRFTQNEKYLFLKSTTEKYVKGRKTVDPSRKSLTFRYFFTVREERLRVCKQFFLGTLNISQKPVYTAHSVESENTPKKNMRGKTGSRKINDDTKNIVMDHISTFPVVESHYCRASSNKKYLEATLSVSKMYDLYLEHCNENNVANPVKLSMYRHIFNTNFNLSFHKPKKDVCEKCSRYYLL